MKMSEKDLQFPLEECKNLIIKEGANCKECFFNFTNFCSFIRCQEFERDDKRNVIFVKENEDERS